MRFVQTPIPLNLKFGALHSPDGFALMGGTWTERVEITLRIALKGILHYQSVAGEREELNVVSLILDGDRHYSRSLDRTRVLDRLRSELREGISISPDAAILALSSDHRRAAGQYDNSQFLQLTDCLVGGVRLLVTEPTHHLVAGGRLEPLRAIMTRFEEGTARLRNSRFGTNFSASAFSIASDGRFEFVPLVCGSREVPEQPSLEF
jgi:hypothetical protein